MEASERILRIRRLRSAETLSRMVNRVRRVALENRLEATEAQIQRVAYRAFSEWNQALSEKLAEALRDGLSGL